MGRFQGATSVWCAGDCLPGGLSWVGSRVVFRVFGWIGLGVGDGRLLDVWVDCLSGGLGWMSGV